EQLQQPVDAFQHIIPHQTSRISLDEVARETNRVHNREVCSDRNIIYNLTERGNTASTSHFVALKDNIVNNRIASGENIIFSITASGLNVGTALYTLDDLPDRLRRTWLDGQEPQKLPSTRNIEPLIPPADSPRVRIESVGTIPGKVKRNTQALVEAAVGDCLARSSYNRSDIELLIHAGTYHSDFIAEPAMAAIVAGNLKINGDIESQLDKKTFAFDLLNGAIGFLNACYAASGMIKAKKFKNAMIVASEIENNVEAPAKELRCLKETSSVVILEESAGGKEGFGNFVFKYFTDYLDTFAAYAVQERGKTYVHFKNDPSIEHYYLKCINETIGELLALEKLAISSIKVIFPPQISSAFISRLSSEMNVCREKFVDIAHDGKDYFTSSLPYALQHAREQQLVKAGDIGLIINVGTGIQIGCAIYYF
ncbi:MAG TPA: 3-oxoacyl-[acyl-carrier-protein] synthase III C-terminal domain-containing protein, partial [Ktedonobacteraceae bacterium]|nr:3-oxoacyl-[acyl-carrier-protein] synthase III C-terminal domain-containing protein [Ktedonobacteraceae bacterium]